MGVVDVERQKPNVLRMRAAGRRGAPGRVGIEDAQGRDERGAARLGHQCRGHLLLHRHGRRAASLSDDGARLSIGDRQRNARADAGGGRTSARSLVACIGGGSNAMGLFHPFLDDAQVEIYGVEAAGHGLASGLHAASIAGGRPGVLHGNRTYLLHGRGRPDQRGALDLGRPRLSRHRPGTRLAQRHQAGEISVGHRRGGARRRSSSARASRASFRRSSRRMRWRE